jgi:hypothetical protein
MLAHHVFPISEVAGCARQSGRRQRRSAVEYRCKRSDRARFGEAELRGWRLLLRGILLHARVC